jgi:hypothetical protein
VPLTCYNCVNNILTFWKFLFTLLTVNSLVSSKTSEHNTSEIQRHKEKIQWGEKMSQNVAVPVSDRVDNVRHTSGYFLSKTLQQRTYMNKARPKYPTNLNGNIYIDNIQKAVVMCLIISTIFPFDVGSSIKKYPDVWRTLSTLDPVVGMIRQMTTAFWILSK